MTSEEFYNKYKQIIPLLPKKAVGNLVKKVRGITPQVAYREIVSSMTFSQKLAMYASLQNKLKKFFEEEESSKQFIEDLRSVAVAKISEKLLGLKI